METPLFRSNTRSAAAATLITPLLQLSKLSRTLRQPRYRSNRKFKLFPTRRSRAVLFFACARVSTCVRECQTIPAILPQGTRPKHNQSGERCNRAGAGRHKITLFLGNTKATAQRRNTPERQQRRNNTIAPVTTAVQRQWYQSTRTRRCDLCDIVAATELSCLCVRGVRRELKSRPRFQVQF